MSAEAPRISVVTCVYNGARYLAQAVESILAQTETDFEYILVDDASQDGSCQIMERYARLDARVVTLYNPTNLNPSGALNRALQAARGEFLAILDQDDLALPERLARQRAFLERHPPVSEVGAQVFAIDSEGRGLRAQNYPVSPTLARWQVLFGAPVLHSAAMLRRAAVLQAGAYPLQQWYVNDYILLTRLMRRGMVTNLPETLTLYRRHPQQTGAVFGSPQRGQALLLIYSLLVERLQLRVPLEEVAGLYDGVRGGQQPDPAALQRTAELLDTILERYVQVENPGGIYLDQIRQDCANRLARMAKVHHRVYPEAARALLQRAFQLDADLLRHRLEKHNNPAAADSRLADFLAAAARAAQ